MSKHKRSEPEDGFPAGKRTSEPHDDHGWHLSRKHEDRGADLPKGVEGHRVGDPNRDPDR